MVQVYSYPLPSRGGKGGRRDPSVLEGWFEAGRGGGRGRGGGKGGGKEVLSSSRAGLRQGDGEMGEEGKQSS
jgi:hypothetical protein